MVVESMQGYNQSDELELMGINDDIEEFPPEVVNFLGQVPDEELIDDLIQYPEVMGDYLPLIGMSRRRRRRLKRRMARMSPAKRKRFKKRLARRRKGRRRGLFALSFLVPGGRMARRIMLIKHRRKLASAGKGLWRKIKKRRSARKKKARLRAAAQRSAYEEQAPAEEEYGPQPSPVEAPLEERRAMQTMEEYPEEMGPEGEPQEVKKAGMGMMLPVIAGGGLLLAMTMMKKK